MQKFIKIKMRDKSSVTLPFEVAEQILNSGDQLIMLNDENGKWTGVSINKSEIVHTERDNEEERHYNAPASPQLTTGGTDPIAIKKLLQEFKPKFLE